MGTLKRSIRMQSPFNNGKAGEISRRIREILKNLEDKK
jgi:hypothetical protein